MAEHKANPEEKKSSKKLIIIIVAALLLLGGGGGAGYYFFVHKADSAADAKDKGHAGKDKKGAKKAEHESEPEHDSEAGHEEEEGAEAKVPAYFDMTQPMNVNFPKGSGATIIQMSLSFLADNESASAALKKHEPMLRNNLMMKINAQSPEQLKTKEGKDALRLILLEEVNSILDKMAHGKHVKEVFFTSFVMQ